MHKFKINNDSGLIDSVPFVLSPNADDRPVDMDIDLIVVHSISLPPGEYGGEWVEKLFTNQLPSGKHPYFEEIKDMKVSSHVLVKRDGSVIQFVPFQRRAWHAGESSYEGRSACNDFSIGIELEGTDSDTFEDSQYESLAELILCLENCYPTIDKRRVTGHSDIAPGRKTDPGTGFDWDKLSKLLSAS